MRIVPYIAEHLAQLQLQPAQARYGHLLASPGYAAALAQAGLSFSAVDADGQVLGCAGIRPEWEGRAIAWALVGAALRGGEAWTVIHRQALVILERAHLKGHRRIETACDPGFRQSARWLSMLGFVPEGRMRRYAPDGRDMVLMARVR